MREFTYKKIDAFTSGKSLGNPAACLFFREGQNLSEQEMQEIASQHKGFVSEVVYCRYDKEDIELSYYSSECEVEFCGHGTIACMYSLIKENPTLLAKEELTIATARKGRLTVYNRIAEQNAVYISAPSPIYSPQEMNRGRVAEELGLEECDLSETYPLEIINAGLNTLIVPVRSLQKEISIYPKEQELKRFCLTQGIDIILIFSLEVDQKQNMAHTRVFAPKFGYLEDPATGSGNSAFGYYMKKHGLWNGEPITLEQGGMRIVYNEVRLMEQDSKVLFGGAATNRIVGTYLI